jgi:hypothetical protein
MAGVDELLGIADRGRSVREREVPTERLPLTNRLWSRQYPKFTSRWRHLSTILTNINSVVPYLLVNNGVRYPGNTPETDEYEQIERSTVSFVFSTPVSETRK